MAVALVACFSLATTPAIRAQGAPPVRPPAAAAGRAPGDSTAADTSNVRRARVLAAEDTIKSPTAAAYVPLTIGARAGTLKWNRDQLFAAGALTLGELIAQVPGATLMASGFMLAPSVVVWHGDPGGVRIIIDGIEREELNPRNGGVTDFAMIPLWTFEEVSLEETAGELRVHARTWRVERTTASTRTDVLTGSENLNLFRGFFGKRSSHGVAVQVAAQQLSTTSVPGMDGDALGAFARLGWASGRWNVDAAMIRQGLNRDVGARYEEGVIVDRTALPAYHGASSLAYVRAAWGDAQSSPLWIQAVAATNASKESQPKSSVTGLGATPVVSDSGDTTASQGEYMAAAGVNRGGFRLSGHIRARSRNGTLDLAPLGRAEYAFRRLSVSGAIGSRAGGSAVWDARAQFLPMDWMRVSGSVGMTQASRASEAVAGSAADLALGWRGRWISAGFRQVGQRAVLGPMEFDSAAIGTVVPEGKAVVIAATGPLTRGWNLRTEVLRWSNPALYRPQTQARSRLWFESSFLEQFPTGNFNILAALTHEYRSQSSLPNGSEPDPQTADAFSVFGTLLEIRIGSAVISWDYRNMVGTYYETFPGFVMPRITSVYGIRWQFWN